MNENKFLINKIMQLTPEEGIFPTRAKGISLIRCDTITKRIPIIYKTVFYIIVQGQKRSYLRDETYQYDAMNFLALSVPLPLEAHVTSASPEKPFLALRIEFETSVLKQLLIQMQHENKHRESSRGICVCPMSAELSHSAMRLIESLEDQQKAEILTPMIVKEMLFYALRGPQAGQLTAFTGQGRHFHQISKVIRHIQKNYNESMEVEQLASIASMSPSSLHQHFKSVTRNTPIQYIKAVRLHQAHQLVTLEKNSISEAAWKVGYQSLSQFSREYKRLFGQSPSETSKHLAIEVR